MAAVQPAANWAPGDSKGYLESVSKRAPLLIDPADAPVYKRLEKRPAYQVQEDWMTDALETNVTPTPPQYAGEPSYNGVDNRSRVSNVVQQFRENWLVAEVAELIAARGGVAGVRSEIQRSIDVKMKKMVKNIERVICSEQAVLLDDGTNGSKLGGYFAKVTTNPVDAGAVNLIDYITQTRFEDMLQTVYDAGGDSDLLFVAQSSMCKIVGRNFEGRANTQENQDRAKHTVDMIVRKFRGQLGNEVDIIPNRSISESALLISESQMAIAELRPIRVFRKDNDTQHKRGFMNTYLTLDFGSEKASSGWKNDNTAIALGS